MSCMHWLRVIFAYLLGSIPTGVLVARILRASDPRSGGSGNIGATNVLRTMGKGAAAVTLAGDFLKGAVPVLIGASLLQGGSTFLYLTAGAAIIGHDFSFLLGFRGGKGVATTLGTVTTLSPLTAIVLTVTWILAVAVTRYSSAGALTAAAAAPVFALLVVRDPGLAIFCLCAGGLLTYTHRGNIKRLVEGRESRIGGG